MRPVPRNRRQQAGEGKPRPVLRAGPPGGPLLWSATPMSNLRIVVLGTLATDPFAGMAWTHMQIAAGLRRLGHDVHYIEATSTWPYDPVRRSKVNDSDYAVRYLASVAEGFGLGDRW